LNANQQLWHGVVNGNLPVTCHAVQNGRIFGKDGSYFWIGYKEHVIKCSAFRAPDSIFTFTDMAKQLKQFSLDEVSKVRAIILRGVFTNWIETCSITSLGIL